MTRVFYICPDMQERSGGIKKIYLHVDILREHGVEAYVLHSRNHFRCEWFENTTPIAYPKHPLSTKIKVSGKNLFQSLKDFFLRKKTVCTDFILSPHAPLSVGPAIQKDDIVVIPEFFSRFLIDAFGFARLVIFNQGAYIMFANEFDKLAFFPEIPFHNIYNNSKIERFIVVSEDNKNYVHYAFPQIETRRVRNSVNMNYFCPSSVKQKQIAFITNRLPQDVVQVILLLQNNEYFKDWSFFPIKGLSEKQVAETLKNSAIFLSFSSYEGFALPPLEAMACGCIVIGYQGQGAKEYLKEPNALPIPQGDILTFCRTIEEVVKNYESYQPMGLRAAEYVRQEYSQLLERETIWQAWSDLIDKKERTIGSESQV